MNVSDMHMLMRAPLPVQERVMDRVADLLLTADALLDLLRSGDAQSLAWAESHAQQFTTRPTQ